MISVSNIISAKFAGINNQAGVSLVEVLITLIVLAIGLVGLLVLQSTITGHSNLSRQYNEAVNVGEQKIEQLRSYEVINTTVGKTAYNDIVNGSSTVTATGVTYNLSWTVTTNTNPDYKTINMTISWTDKNNTSQSVNLVSHVGKIDPALGGKALQIGGGSLSF